MDKIYVYYEENCGKLVGDCDACSDLHLFKSKDKAKQQIISTIRTYAGTDSNDSGCDRFCVDKDALDKAGITFEEDVKLTDAQIHTVVETLFADDGFCFTLYADEQENWDEYFVIRCYQKEIE